MHDPKRWDGGGDGEEEDDKRWQSDPGLTALQPAFSASDRMHLLV